MMFLVYQIGISTQQYMPFLTFNLYWWPVRMLWSISLREQQHRQIFGIPVVLKKRQREIATPRQRIAIESACWLHTCPIVSAGCH